METYSVISETIQFIKLDFCRRFKFSPVILRVFFGKINLSVVFEVV